MASSQQTAEMARFRVENIGGITETDVDVPPGVTVLSGENATNRTSFLQAIMAAMGGEQATLKGDADEGRVHFEFRGDTYERTLQQDGDRVQITGEGYLEDPEVADLFAFLVETNEARQVVDWAGDLREIIMRPIDIEAIKRDIERLEVEKNDINDELATIESRKTDLPHLEQQRTELRNEIEEKREELGALEEDIDEHSRVVEETLQEQKELEAKLDELRSTRSDLETVRRDIKTQEESITSLEQERSDLEDELADFPDAPMGQHADLEARIDRLRSQRQTLNANISDLQSLIQYNEERLEEGDYKMLKSVKEDTDADSTGSVTDQLLAEDEGSVVCWTCGTTVERGQIEGTVDRLQDLRSQKVNQLNDIKDELEKLKTERREAEQKQRRRDALQDKLDDIDNELARREEHLDSLKNRREALTADVETLEAEMETLESEDFDDILALHKQANHLEFEIDSLETDLKDVSEEIEEIEAMIEKADDLRDQREELLEELTARRTKINQIEQEAVDQFNNHMDSILEILGYENLERIWIERVERTVREGRQKVDQTTFELHVVRTTESGIAYEDSVDHLSESEREVTGLIFALAGYLVHDLHESVPFMILDSLEAIDADRIAALVDYFADYADFLVVALLKDDAEALADDYTYISNI